MDDLQRKHAVCGLPKSESRTNVKTAFVNLLRYLNRPYPTLRCGDSFTNAAIMQLATYEIDITIEQPSFGSAPLRTTEM